MPNTEASRKFDDSTDKASAGMSATTIFTFCLNILFQGAMKEIIGTIVSMQIVINLFLFTIPFPANISTYVQKLKPIVSFNILKVLT